MIARLRVLLAAAALALAVSTAAAWPQGARASSSGCTHSDGMPASCVAVKGVGLYVDSVSAGVDVQIRSTVYGRFEVWGPGFHIYGHRHTFWNQSWWHHHTYWVTWPMRRRIRPGTICARWDERSGGTWHPKPAACETVHG